MGKTRKTKSNKPPGRPTPGPGRQNNTNTRNSHQAYEKRPKDGELQKDENKRYKRPRKQKVNTIQVTDDKLRRRRDTNREGTTNSRRERQRRKGRWKNKRKTKERKDKRYEITTKQDD